MTHKAKTKNGTWVHGFLIGYYSSVDKETVESFAIFEGIKGVDAVGIDEGTICQFVCKDRDGNNAYINDYIELREGDRCVQCLLIKEENGFGIYPSYQDGSLWRLNIGNGVGEFKVVGNRFDDGDKLKNWLDRKQEWFRRRIYKKE